jgi:hypothetical protein
MSSVINRKTKYLLKILIYQPKSRIFCVVKKNFKNLLHKKIELWITLLKKSAVKQKTAQITSGLLICEYLNTDLYSQITLITSTSV